MIVFSFAQYKAIALGLLKDSKNKAGEFEVKPFENGELHCKVSDKVKDKACAIVSSFTAGSELKPLLLAHTLKRLGAKKVILIAPYLGYMRQDKVEPQRSLSAAWVGGMLKCSGINSILTVDLHSDQAKKLLSLPVVSLEGSAIFASALKSFLSDDVTIMAPDAGALPKAEVLMKATSKVLPVTHFDKVRTEDGIKLTPPKTKITKRVVLVDDVLDTGGTLVGACRILKERGVKEIVICVTHGQFVGEKWKQLWKLGVSKIYTTNSLPNAPKDKRIQIVTLAPLFRSQKL